LIGVGGILVGALIGGIAQAWVQRSKNQHDERTRRKERAEEVLTLVAASPWWYTPIKKAALQDPSNFPTPPTEPHRVFALVALYFPGALESAQKFELACVSYLVSLQEIAKLVKQEQPVPPDVKNPATFDALYVARQALIDAMRREVDPNSAG